MFKIITEGQATPVLFMLCDASCPTSITASVQLGTEESVATHQQFAVEAASQGWLVRFDRQLCPVHAKQHAEQVQIQQRRILVVSRMGLN